MFYTLQEENSYVAVTLFWPPNSTQIRQLRVEGKAEKISRIESEKNFHQRPRAVQVKIKLASLCTSVFILIYTIRRLERFLVHKVLAFRVGSISSSSIARLRRNSRPTRRFRFQTGWFSLSKSVSDK